jgi:hypothetical protein
MYKKNASFIIASNRAPNIVRVAIDSINSLPKTHSYEILLYSPYEPISTENVKWFKEENQNGPHVGFNYLVNRTEGEYVYQITDDQVVLEDVWDAIELLESKLFTRRQYKITTLNTGHGPVRCGWQHPGGWRIPDHLCMRFPVIHKETITNHFQGYFYHPELIYHQADAWMGYWLGETGESGIECTGTTMPHVGLINNHHTERDTNLYFDLIRTFLSGNRQYVRDGSRNGL